MLIMFALALLAGMVYFTYATPLYQAKSLVYFQTFGSALQNRDLPETTGSSSGLSRSLVSRLNSQQVKIAAAQRMGLLGERATYEDFLEHVPVVRVGIVDPRHLEINVQAYDPVVVRGFTEALVESFQEFQEASWTEFRDEALERYAAQVTELEKKVTENIESLSKLERDNQYTEVTIEQQNLLQIPKNIVETREKLTRMGSIRETLGKYDSASAEPGNALTILSLLANFDEETDVEVGNLVRRPISGVRAPVAGNTDELRVVQPSDVDGLESWRELEKERRRLEAEIEQASQIFLPDHPKMKELTETFEDTERALVAEMVLLRDRFDLEYGRLTEKLGQLEARLPEYQSITEQLGKSAMQYQSVEQAQEMWATAREKLSEKLATITFAEDFDWVQLRFKRHTSLRDENPISPNKRKLFIMSILLGIAGAIGVPTVLNLLDTSATNVTQLEDYLGLKGIGIVPLSDPDFLDAVHRSPAQGSTVPNYLLECFRVIRSNITLDAKTDGAKVVLVTSARPQEGKTTQSANLAWAFHSVGERVLLVDCDLRRGRVHNLLKMDNEIGMSRFLMGEASSKEAIQTTEQEGFDTITRGPIIPGATELLCQEIFENLIASCRDKYDRIILDCPPVLGLSESSSLQRLADGIVLVVRAEKTSLKDVRDAVYLLHKTGAHFYGFVLNGVDLSKIGNYYQYYYYSAPYYDQFDLNELDRNSPAIPDRLNPNDDPASKRPGHREPATDAVRKKSQEQRTPEVSEDSPDPDRPKAQQRVSKADSADSKDGIQDFDS